MPENPRALEEFLNDPSLPSVEPSPIRFSEAMTDIIDTAEEREVPMVFAYIDESNAIRQTFRGSIHVHGEQQLAFWNRDPKGGLIRALAAGNDAVCATYRERDTPRLLQFHGHARVEEDPDERTRVYGQSPELERNLAHGRNGVAVVIELDRIQGVDQPPGTGAWEAFAMSRG
jgi:hypothetical protein